MPDSWRESLQSLLTSPVFGFPADRVAEALAWGEAWDSRREGRNSLTPDTPARPARLFGTSGIRGLAPESCLEEAFVPSPAATFQKEGRLSRRLAYWCARSTARTLEAQGVSKIAYVGADVRESNARLLIPIVQGLLEEGWKVCLLGVAPTPAFTLYPHNLTFMLTASHNPPEYNGIKVFWNHGPLTRELEAEVETEMALWEEADRQGGVLRPVVDGGSVKDHRLEHLRLHYYRLMSAVFADGLLQQEVSLLSGKLLPLDLAAGAAASQPPGAGRQMLVGSGLLLFLQMGVTVVGYGTEQDAAQCNQRLGAAYPYGETPDKLGPGELAAFARCRHGYGAPASRSFYFPQSHSFRSPELLEEARILRLAPYLPEASPGEVLAYAFLDVDSQERAHLVKPLEQEIEGKPLLPGLMVDGDGDRLLVTTEGFAGRKEGFVPGELLLRSLAVLGDPDDVRGLATTVESGLSVETPVNAAAEGRKQAGKPALEFQSTAVGDRSLMAFLMARKEGGWIAGEPSGHVIFTEKYGKFEVIDDPFATYFRWIKGFILGEQEPDAALQDLLERHPEVYTARRPEAWGGGQLSATEKAALTLHPSGKPDTLSDYARAFIPQYVQWFIEAYCRAFHEGKGVLRFTESAEAKALLEGNAISEIESGWMAWGTAEIEGAVPETVAWRLAWDARPWADPEAIILSAWVHDPQTGAERKAGEGVFRNSGTSPKNAGYHKLWPVHFGSGKMLSEGKLRMILDDLAQRRAAFTDDWITFLRTR